MSKQTDYQRAWYERNREKAIATSREWAKKNPERLKAGKTRRYAAKYRYTRYGLTAETYADLLAFQDGRCAICKSANSGRPEWNVDHDHVTNEVRGLLCSGCNTALGHYEKRIREKLADFNAYLGNPPKRRMFAIKPTLSLISGGSKLER